MNLFGILLSNTDLWLLAIAGACLAWLIPHRLAYWREKESRRAAARHKFRATFLTAFSTVYPHPTVWPQNIDAFLKAAFPTLQAAVRELQDALPWWQQWRFSRAWLRYCCSTGRECDKNTYHHYMPSHSPGEHPPDVKAIFHKNVSHLLSYAK